MLQFIKQVFDYNAREISRLKKRVEEINLLEDKARNLADEQFKLETESIKKSIASGEKSLDDHLPWAYALVREAARRVLGQRHFDVQLMAGIALHEGKITEQKTGEGKTLAATTALYLNALKGKGAHLVTVNDYLARRDAGWNGNVYHFLGLSTAAIISDASFIFDPEYTDNDAADSRLSHLRSIDRKAAYLADITYGINSEFGFDYLRDNMVSAPEQINQRGFYFAIIDEADSVLIDEARTPHIISAPYSEDTSKYYEYAKLVKRLDSATDYVVDEKMRSANLTESGIHKMESFLNIENIYEKDFDSVFHIEAALKAETLFHREKEYIVRGNEVVIVDEFTGRLLEGRRFSEGLHQAIEAKENVKIQRESKTLATVSLQNYFRMYEKLGGMTGTAATEAEEFHKIYKTDVVTIPTHRKMVRADHPDMIYKTERAKFNAVVQEIIDNYKKGRPVLVGTTSIEKNELVSRLLTQRGIQHEVLNAKNHEREAQIISRAGEKGAITVATNMAGRGVDILLGGTPPDQEEEKKDKEKFKKDLLDWQAKHDEVIGLGGLYVIGTERHESRRIDNQLRGRSGRQGDPGETRFFVALEDDLMRIFGGEQITKLMDFLKFPEDQPLSHSMVSRAIEQAQIKVEGHNFDIRKHLVDFDDVLNKQRDIIYSLRKKILLKPESDQTEFKQTIFGLIDEEITNILQSYEAQNESLGDADTQTLTKDLAVLFPDLESEIMERVKKQDFPKLREFLKEKTESDWKSKEEKVGSQIWLDGVRQIFLSTIDQFWTQHLTAIEDLREGINLRGYAQLDPLVEYKNEAFSMFEKLLAAIDFESTRRLLRTEINIVQEQPKADEPKNLNFQAASAVSVYNDNTQSPKQRTVQNDQTKSKSKIGRNDPCWCGSGKKYKKCHYPN